MNDRRLERREDEALRASQVSVPKLKETLSKYREKQPIVMSKSTLAKLIELVELAELRANQAEAVLANLKVSSSANEEAESKLNAIRAIVEEPIVGIAPGAGAEEPLGKPWKFDF